MNNYYILLCFDQTILACILQLVSWLVVFVYSGVSNKTRGVVESVNTYCGLRLIVRWTYACLVSRHAMTACTIEFLGQFLENSLLGW